MKSKKYKKTRSPGWYGNRGILEEDRNGRREHGRGAEKNTVLDKYQ